MSRFLSDGGRFLRKGSRFVGQGRPLETPLETQYPPQDFEGTVAYADDGKLYFSDGNAWVIPTDDVLVARPVGQVPTNAAQQKQLRLSSFRSPGGLSQTGIQFEISTNNVDFEGALIRNVNDAFASLYDVLYPEDGFEPGDEIFWRGLYTATDGGQSDYSIPIRQTMPEFIERPTTPIRNGELVSILRVDPFFSPYGWDYVETEWEIYSDETMTTLEANVVNGGETFDVPDGLNENTVYYWRARYGGRSDFGQPINYSDWLPLQGFNNAGKSMILTFDLSKAAGTTVSMMLGYNTGVLFADSRYCDVVVDWGDGTPPETFSSSTGVVAAHTYDLINLPGTVATVIITGEYSSFGGGSTNQKLEHLTRIENWGFGLGLKALNFALFNAPNLEFISPDLPASVTSMANFADSSFFNNTVTGIGSLNTANVRNMARAFYNSNFNQDISGWDTSSVTTMSEMFQSANVFNNGGQPLTWNVSSVTDMSGMFQQASSFNQDLNDWDVSGVTTFASMFKNATNFNGAIGAWNTVSATTFASMFYSAVNFNQDIGSWNLSQVTSLFEMFREAVSFNRDLNLWDVSNVQNFERLFFFAESFNGDVSAWNTASATSLSQTFELAVVFNQDIGGWNTSNVIKFVNTFRNAHRFNQDISGWDVSKGRDFRRTFDQSFNFTDFDQDIGAWAFRREGIPDDFSPQFQALSPQNYSRTITGWANSVSEIDGPYNQNMFASSANTTMIYDTNNYVTGGRFSNAAVARAYLTGPRAVSVTGASTPDANTSYAYNGTTLTYDASNGWYFAVLGNGWALYDPTDTEQAAGSGPIPGTSPQVVTGWDGILLTAEVLRTGAGWTITGDAPA